MAVRGEGGKGQPSEGGSPAVLPPVQLWEMALRAGRLQRWKTYEHPQRAELDWAEHPEHEELG